MSVTDIIEKALYVRSRYQKVIAGNIANVDTPGYKEKDIDFERELASRMKGSKEVEVIETPRQEGFVRLDENTVSVEDQVVKMTENSLIFSALVTAISKKFTLMRYVINGGR